MPKADEALLLRPKDAAFVVSHAGQFQFVDINVCRPTGPGHQPDWLMIEAPGPVKIKNAPSQMRFSGSDLGCHFDRSIDGGDIDLDSESADGVMVKMPVTDAGGYSPKSIRCTLHGGDVVITVVAVDEQGIRVQIEVPAGFKIKPPAAAGSAPEPGSILQRVIEIVAEEMGFSKDQVEENTNFIDELGADSIDLIEMVGKFECEFGIKIPMGEVQHMQTVRNAVFYIEKAKGQ